MFLRTILSSPHGRSGRLESRNTFLITSSTLLSYRQSPHWTCQQSNRLEKIVFRPWHLPQTTSHWWRILQYADICIFIYVLIYHPGIAIATQIIKPDYQIYEKMLDFCIFFFIGLYVSFSCLCCQKGCRGLVITIEVRVFHRELMVGWGGGSQQSFSLKDNKWLKNYTL